MAGESPRARGGAVYRCPGLGRPGLLDDAAHHPVCDGRHPSTSSSPSNPSPAWLTPTPSQYQLRYCPALAKKPTPRTQPLDGKEKQRPDPFEHPREDLLIGPCGPAHFLILNKFPIIPHHFILATKAFKPQTDLLERDDLSATYACLRAWQPHYPAASPIQERPEAGERPRRLFAFYNSGPHSGASQPHRHVQFLPVEAMRGDDGRVRDHGPAVTPWEPLIDLVLARPDHPQLTRIRPWPLAHFARALPAEPTPDVLHDIYIELYHRAVAAAEHQTPVDDTAHSGENNDIEIDESDGNGPIGKPAKISYNLAMTVSGMMICPRRNSEASLPPAPPSSPTANANGSAGRVSPNGTILAGTLMVKTQDEWDILRAQPELLDDILALVGFPPPPSSL
jgi:sulfate adenylyltransferase (ADP) / ATP adenylyltransferase